MDGAISLCADKEANRTEIENCPQFWGTTSSATWNPHETMFEEDENAMNGALPRRELDSVRTDVDTESDDMELDSGDDNDSDDTSEMSVESQTVLTQDLGDDLYMRLLQSLAQPRNIAVIGIAEDGMLLDRMLRCRNISDQNLSDSSQGVRCTINPSFQCEMNECFTIHSKRRIAQRNKR